MYVQEERPHLITIGGTQQIPAINLTAIIYNTGAKPALIIDAAATGMGTDDSPIVYYARRISSVGKRLLNRYEFIEIPIIVFVYEDISKIEGNFSFFIRVKYSKGEGSILLEKQAPFVLEIRNGNMAIHSLPS